MLWDYSESPRTERTYFDRLILLGKYFESASYMLLGIGVCIKNRQDLLFHRNQGMWHKAEECLNILLLGYYIDNIEIYNIYIHKHTHK